MSKNVWAATALAMLALAGCSKTDNSDGNGPGNADGIGGKTDSAEPLPEPAPPATEAPLPTETLPGAAPGSTATDSVPPPVDSTGNTTTPPPPPP
jgi:hypothetical protein